jgi:drug/metabolite transporter (DMT)-like permease
LALGLVFAGMVNVVGIAFYLKSLRSGDAVEVTIFGESAPLIALALGVVFLGEDVTATQGLAFTLIMGAAVIMVLSTKRKRGGRLNLATAGLAFVGTFFWVVSDILYVGWAGNGISNFTYFGQTFFYFEMGAFMASLLALVCVPSWRRTVRVAFFGESKGRNLAAMVLDNGIYTLGEFCFKIGLLMAPVVALMSVVSHVAQLGIVFVLGIFLARFFPRISGERYSKKLLMQHLVAVALVVTGIIVLG